MLRKNCFAFVVALLWAWLPVFAHAAVERAALTNFDQRAKAPQAAAKAGQHLAHNDLKQRLPGAAADFDPVLGSPTWVHGGR